MINQTFFNGNCLATTNVPRYAVEVRSNLIELYTQQFYLCPNYMYELPLHLEKNLSPFMFCLCSGRIYNVSKPNKASFGRAQSLVRTFGNWENCGFVQSYVTYVFSDW